MLIMTLPYLKTFNDSALVLRKPKSFNMVQHGPIGRPSSKLLHCWPLACAHIVEGGKELFYKSTNPFHKGSALMTLISPKGDGRSPSITWWALRFQIWIWRDTVIQTEAIPCNVLHDLAPAYWPSSLNSHSTSSCPWFSKAHYLL